MALTDSFTDSGAVVGTVKTLTAPNAVPVGSFIVASVTANGGSTTCAITDPRSNTWTQRSTATYTSNTITNFALACKVTTALQAGDTITITFGATRTNYASVFGVFNDGVSTTLDGAAATALANTITPTAGPTGDPATARALVILAGGARGSALSFTGGGTTVGYASSGTSTTGRAAFLGYAYVASPGTQTPSGTLGVLENWVAEAMAFDAVVSVTTTGVVAGVTLSAPAGTADGSATVAGVVASVSFDAPAGTAAGAGGAGVAVTGVTAAATLSAPSGTVTGSAAVTGAPSAVCGFSAPADVYTDTYGDTYDGVGVTGSSGAAGATVAGITADITLTAPAGTAAGIQQATVVGGTAVITYSAPAGTVSAVRHATVTGVTATCTVLAPAGTVAAGSTLAGPVATLTLAAPAGSPVSGATVAAAPAALTWAAPAGAATGVQHATVTGAIAALTLSAPAGVAHGHTTDRDITILAASLTRTWAGELDAPTRTGSLTRTVSGAVLGTSPTGDLTRDYEGALV